MTNDSPTSEPQPDLDAPSLIADACKGRDADKMIDAGAAFKAYTHQRLDEAGVATHPNGKHSEAGCRVGDRFDLLIGERDRLAERVKVLEAAGKGVLASWNSRISRKERYVPPREGDEPEGYWSPSAAMVDSAAIYALRAALGGEHDA